MEYVRKYGAKVHFFRNPVAIDGQAQETGFDGAKAEMFMAKRPGWKPGN